MTGYFDLLIERLKSQIDGPLGGKVDIVAWLNYFTFDVIGDLTFGEPFGSLDRGDLHYWIANVFKSFELFRYMHLARAFPILWYTFLLLSKIPSVAKAQRVHWEFAFSALDKRMRRRTDRVDFLSHVSSMLVSGYAMAC